MSVKTKKKMKNKDAAKQEALTLVQPIVDAATGEDKEKFQAALADFALNLQSQIIAEAEEMADIADTNILAQRGVRQLTSRENEYYNAVIDAMRSGNPQQALSEMEVVLPETVIEMVFDELTQEHPLLDAINFTNTGALVKWILSTSGGVAAWGKLTGEIKDELSASFEEVNLSLNKLSAFFPVDNAMLDLGPAWLDRYVRAILVESIATELEASIVDGDGDDKPIGMTRQLTGNTGKVFPRKTPVVVNKLDPVTVGGILEKLTKTRTGKRRAIPELLMVVGPADYYTRVFPATAIRTAAGAYNTDVLPYRTKVIVSPAVPDGMAVFGIASKYFFGLGTSNKSGRLEYSDEFKFLDDQRTYRIKLYGNGRALDENAFILADISGLKPSLLQVEVVSTAPEV